MSAHCHLPSEPSGPGDAGLHRLGQAAVGVEPHRLGLDVELGDPLAEDRVVGRGAAVDAGLGGQRGEPLEAVGDLGDRAEGEPGALVHQRRDRHRPAVADAADDVGVGDPRLLDEDLVELALAGDLDQRPDLDALLLHVHQEVGEALVLGGVGVGAGDEHAPLRVLGEASSRPSAR